MQQKFKKLFFVFQIIAFEFIAGISLNYERIHAIRRQRVKKKSKIFDMIQRDVFQRNLCVINKKLG